MRVKVIPWGDTERDWFFNQLRNSPDAGLTCFKFSTPVLALYSDIGGSILVDEDGVLLRGEFYSTENLCFMNFDIDEFDFLECVFNLLKNKFPSVFLGKKLTFDE